MERLLSNTQYAYRESSSTDNDLHILDEWCGDMKLLVNPNETSAMKNRKWRKHLEM